MSHGGGVNNCACIRSKVCQVNCRATGLGGADLRWSCPVGRGQCGDTPSSDYATPPACGGHVPTDADGAGNPLGLVAGPHDPQALGVAVTMKGRKRVLGRVTFWRTPLFVFVFQRNPFFVLVFQPPNTRFLPFFNTMGTAWCPLVPDTRKKKNEAGVGGGHWSAVLARHAHLSTLQGRTWEYTVLWAPDSHRQAVFGGV